MDCSFRKAAHGNQVSRVFHADGNAAAEREQLEWLAKISPEYESQLRSLLREEAEARADRERPQWLDTVTVPDVTRRPAADAAAQQDLLEWVDQISVRDGVIAVYEGNWDPAKHPRTWTPPNPGWWAPTGSSGSASDTAPKQGTPGSGSERPAQSLSTKQLAPDSRWSQDPGTGDRRYDPRTDEEKYGVIRPTYGSPEQAQAAYIDSVRKTSGFWQSVFIPGGWFDLGIAAISGFAGVPGLSARGGQSAFRASAGRGGITGYTRHGLNQAVGRDRGTGVSQAAILDAVMNPQSIGQQSGGRVKYVGKDATVVLNKDGKVITTWAHGTQGTRGGN